MEEIVTIISCGLAQGPFKGLAMPLLEYLGTWFWGILDFDPSNYEQGSKKEI